MLALTPHLNSNPKYGADQMSGGLFKGPKCEAQRAKVGVDSWGDSGKLEGLGECCKLPVRGWVRGGVASTIKRFLLYFKCSEWLLLLYSCPMLCYTSSNMHVCHAQTTCEQVDTACYIQDSITATTSATL